MFKSPYKIRKPSEGGDSFMRTCGQFSTISNKNIVFHLFPFLTEGDNMDLNNLG